MNNFFKRFCVKHRGNSEQEEANFENTPKYLRIALQSVISELLQLLDLLVKDDESLSPFSADKFVNILKWLGDVCKRGDLFQKMIAEEWTKLNSKGESLLDPIMERHPKLPQVITGALHKLFFPLLFVSFFRKRFLQRHFIPYYKKYVEQHVRNERDEKGILSDFPIQLFTVSNCTPIFKEEKLIEIILEKMKNIFSSCLLKGIFKNE